MRKIGFITLIFILAISFLFSQTSRELDYNIVATGSGYGLQGSQYVIELQMRAHTTIAELGSGQMRITFNSAAMTLNIGASSVNSDIVNYDPFSLGLSYSTDHVYSPATGKVQAGIVFDQALAGLAYDIPTVSWLNFAHVVFDITDPSQTSQIAWIETTPETQFYAEDNVTSHTNNLFTGNDDTPLPVNLSSFYVLYLESKPTLYWTTQTEIENAYWNVYRGLSDNFETAILLNANNPVPGNGTTNSSSDYVYIDNLPVIQNTTYWYWIEDVSTDGESEVHEAITLSIPFGDSPQVPIKFGLHQNYPNPFNPSTMISFTLEEECEVEIVIFNIKGKQVKKYIVPSHQNSIVWDGTDNSNQLVSSGVYFYKLITETKEYQRKMLLIK